MCWLKAVLQGTTLYKDNIKKDMLILHLKKAHIYHYLLIHGFPPPALNLRV